MSSSTTAYLEKVVVVAVTADEMTVTVFCVDRQQGRHAAHWQRNLTTGEGCTGRDTGGEW